METELHPVITVLYTLAREGNELAEILADQVDNRAKDLTTFLESFAQDLREIDQALRARGI